MLNMGSRFLLGMRSHFVFGIGSHFVLGMVSHFVLSIGSHFLLGKESVWYGESLCVGYRNHIVLNMGRVTLY